MLRLGDRQQLRTLVTSTYQQNLNNRLVDVARTGDLNLMMALKRRGADLNALDENTTGVLHNAVGNCQNDELLRDSAPAKLIVTWLLENGAHINLRDGLQRTPLHWASLRGDPQLVRQLLDAGADREIADIDHRKPLDLAANDSIATLLKDHNIAADQGADKKMFSERVTQSRKSSHSASPER